MSRVNVSGVVPASRIRAHPRRGTRGVHAHTRREYAMALRELGSLLHQHATNEMALEREVYTDSPRSNYDQNMAIGPLSTRRTVLESEMRRRRQRLSVLSRQLRQAAGGID